MIIEWNGCDVDVEFTYEPGMPPKLTGHPDSWDAGYDEELEIYKVMYEGVNVLPLFSDTDYEALVEKLFKGIEEERNSWI